MLNEIEGFQQQTENLVQNLQMLDQIMGNNNRELEVVDDDKKPKCLDEEDLADQKIYSYNPLIHKLKDCTCSICLGNIVDPLEEAKE